MCVCVYACVYVCMHACMHACNDFSACGIDRRRFHGAKPNAHEDFAPKDFHCPFRPTPGGSFCPQSISGEDSKSPEFPQKEGAFGSEIAAQNHIPLAISHRTLTLQFGSSQTWSFQTWLFAFFSRKRSLALFCGPVRLRSSACFCVRPRLERPRLGAAGQCSIAFSF